MNKEKYTMNFDIYDLSAKAIIGEELTDEEKSILSEYNAKYKIVRHLVMEKQKHQGVKLVNFQFTPGDEFLKTPTIDIVNSIIESLSFITKQHDFGDGTFILDDDGVPIPRVKHHNPPVTGKSKTNLRSHQHYMRLTSASE